MKQLGLILTCVIWSSCVTRPQDRCARCTIVDAQHPYVPRFKPRANTLFVLMPGGLGYGWEWDRAVEQLRKSELADFVIFDWDPFRGLEFVARDFSTLCRMLFMQLPPRVKNVVIIAHSAAGLVGAYAAHDIVVPAGKNISLVTIGTPFAGMNGLGVALPDPISSPVMLGIFGAFEHYPEPSPMLKVIEYVTSYPSDKVMKHRFGHDPAPGNIGPTGAERIMFPQEMDHNLAVEAVVDAQLKGITP